MAIIDISNGDGAFPVRRERPLVNDLASGISNPIITPSMTKKATTNVTDPGALSSGAVTPSELKKIAGKAPSKSVQINLDGEQAHTPAPKEKIAEAVMKKWDLEAAEFFLDNLDGIKHINITVFTREDIHPLVALVAMTKIFGLDWLEWEPETIWSELADMGATDINRSVKDTIMAARAAQRINDFYEDFYSFTTISNAFNHHVVDFHTFNPPAVAEMVNTINILKQIRTDTEFGFEIAAFIKSVAHFDGMIVFPPQLDFVEKPDPMLSEDVMLRYIEMSENPDADYSADSIIDNQAIKLLTVKKYCEEENKRFSDEINTYFFLTSV